MEKLKLDWKTINKINNKIVMARISGYGQNDALEKRQAFDATIQAETGFMQISGHDEKPTMIGTVFLDYTTGLNTAVGILAALNFRNQTDLSPEKHLEVARWFGEVESTFYNHPKSPSLDITSSTR